MSEAYLGKVLVLRNGQGAVVAVGVCKCYCDAPTITVEDQWGKHTHWRADMTTVLTDDPHITAALFPVTDGLKFLQCEANEAESGGGLPQARHE